MAYCLADQKRRFTMIDTGGSGTTELTSRERCPTRIRTRQLNTSTLVERLGTESDERLRFAEIVKPVAEEAVREYVINYMRLGALAGDLATPMALAATRRFWRSAGKEGAEWLVERLRAESDSSTFDHATSLLLDMESYGADVITAALRKDGASTRAFRPRLLEALSWFQVGDEALARSILGLLNDLRMNPEADVRAAAYRASVALGSEVAQSVLSDGLKVERDSEVRDVIEEVTAELRSRV